MELGHSRCLPMDDSSKFSLFLKIILSEDRVFSGLPTYTENMWADNGSCSPAMAKWPADKSEPASQKEI